MKTTVAGVRGNKNAKQHCGNGHEFTVGTAYEDAHGEWCKECGEGATSGSVATCRRTSCWHNEKTAVPGAK